MFVIVLTSLSDSYNVLITLFGVDCTVIGVNKKKRNVSVMTVLYDAAFCVLRVSYGQTGCSANGVRTL